VVATEWPGRRHRSCLAGSQKLQEKRDDRCRWSLARDLMKPRRCAASGTALCVIVLLCTPVFAAAQSAARGRVDPAQVDRLIVEQTNDFRVTAGAAPTRGNRQLAEAARYFADYMARTDRYGHDADGSEPSQRAAARGYEYCMVSENIAFEYNSEGFQTQELARRFVEGWKQSAGHRHNMLDPEATETAVAVAQSSRSGRYYAVQMFGRPQLMRVSFRISNRSPAAVRYELGGEWFQLPPRMTRTHEHCEAKTLSLRLPGEPEATTLQPANGEHYEVERFAGRYRLSKGRG